MLHKYTFGKHVWMDLRRARYLSFIPFRNLSLTPKIVNQVRVHDEIILPMLWFYFFNYFPNSVLLVRSLRFYSKKKMLQDSNLKTYEAVFRLKLDVLL